MQRIRLNASFTDNRGEDWTIVKIQRDDTIDTVLMRHDETGAETWFGTHTLFMAERWSFNEQITRERIAPAGSPSIVVQMVKVGARYVGLTVSDRWNLETLADLGVKLADNSTKGQTDRFRRNASNHGIVIIVVRPSKKAPITVNVGPDRLELDSMGLSNVKRLSLIGPDDFAPTPNVEFLGFDGAPRANPILPPTGGF